MKFYEFQNTRILQNMYPKLGRVSITLSRWGGGWSGGISWIPVTEFRVGWWSLRIRKIGAGPEPPGGGGVQNFLKFP